MELDGATSHGDDRTIASRARVTSKAESSSRQRVVSAERLDGQSTPHINTNSAASIPTHLSTVLCVGKAGAHGLCGDWVQELHVAVVKGRLQHMP